MSPQQPAFEGDKQVLVRQLDSGKWYVSYVTEWPRQLLDFRTLGNREFDTFAEVSAFVEGELLA